MACETVFQEHDQRSLLKHKRSDKMFSRPSHSPHWSGRGRVSSLLCQSANVRLTTGFSRRITFDYYFVSVIKRSRSSLARPPFRCVTGIIVHLMLKLLLFQSARRFCCLAHSFSDSLCPFGCAAFWPTLVYTTRSLEPSRKIAYL